jgi:hypothetical protein
MLELDEELMNNKHTFRIREPGVSGLAAITTIVGIPGQAALTRTDGLRPVPASQKQLS